MNTTAVTSVATTAHMEREPIKLLRRKLWRTSSSEGWRGRLMTVYNVNSLSPDSAADVYDCRKEAGMNKHNLTILYSRLSVDDDRDGESGSIQNQKMLLEAYAEKNDLKPYIHIFDDGYSGTGWDRPGWQKVIEEIEAGHVQNLVCKNLDRLGRDYLRVGLLMEMLKEKSIRLIAISDGIDTLRGEDDFTPFCAILGEWYARDCSNFPRRSLRLSP